MTLLDRRQKDGPSPRGQLAFFGIMILALMVLASQPVRAEKILRYQEGIIRSWIEGNIGDIFERPAVYPTENFVIYYLESHFPSEDDVPDYVVRVHGELEAARQAFLNLGFAEPRSGRKELITVILLDPSALPVAYGATGELDVGEIWKPDVAGGITPGSYIVLRNNLALEHMQFSIAHEVFHLFQNAPDILDDYETRRFILEQTAVWATNTVNTGIHPDQGYTGRIERFWEYWVHENTPLIGAPPFEMNDHNQAVWYGTGAFLLWLDAQTGQGVPLARDLIGDPVNADNIAKAWHEAMARHVPDGDVPQSLLRAGLALWLMDGPPPYRMPRGRLYLDYISALLDDHRTRLGSAPPLSEVDGAEDPFADGYIGRFDAASGRITPAKQRIEALGVRAMDLDTLLMEDANADQPLFIAFAPDDPERVRVGIVETSPRFESHTQRVTELDPYPGQAGGSFVVPSFGSGDLGFTESVWVMAVNGDWRRVPGGVENYRVTVNIGGPPMLEAVTVEADGEPIYDAAWTVPEEEDAVLSLENYFKGLRELAVETNGLTATQRRTESLSDVFVTLRFSRPVWLKSVALDEASFTIGTGEEEYRTEWRVEAYHIPVTFVARQAGHMTLSVEAVDRTGARLDGDPETRAALSVKADKWIGWEDEDAQGHAGGVDKSHEINLGSEIAYLEAVRLRTPGGGAYHQEWMMEEGAAERSLSGPDSVPLDPQDGEAVYLLELQFNTPLGDGLQVTLGGVTVPMNQLAGSGGYYAELTAQDLAPALSQNPMPLIVTGVDREGRPIDADPSTMANLEEGWETGPDTNHAIPVAETGLSLFEPLGLNPGPPFRFYELFDFDDALSLAPGISSFSLLSPGNEYPRESGHHMRRSDWGMHPELSIHPELYFDPREMESHGRVDPLRKGFDYFDFSERTLRYQTIDVSMAWSTWPSTGVVGPDYQQMSVSMKVYRYTGAGPLLQQSIAGALENGYQDGGGVFPGYDGAILWTQAQLHSLEGRNFKAVVVQGNWQFFIEANRSAHYPKALEDMVPAIMARILPRLAGRETAGQQPYPDGVEQFLERVTGGLDSLARLRASLETETHSGNAEGLQAGIAMLRQDLGIELGRYERFSERLPEGHWPTLYPEAAAVVDALRRASIQPLPEPVFDPPPAEQMDPAKHDHNPNPLPPGGVVGGGLEAPEIGGGFVPPAPPPAPPPIPTLPEIALGADPLQGLVAAASPTGPGVELVRAFTAASKLWNDSTDFMRRRLVDEYFDQPIEAQYRAPLFHRSLMLSAQRER